MNNGEILCPACVKNKEAPNGYKHIYVRLPDQPLVRGEWLWAHETMVETRVRIANIPFFAYDIALDDVAEIRDDQDEHRWELVKIVVPSGFEVVRLLFVEEMTPEAMIDFDRVTSVLGGSSEWFNPRIVGINAKPELIPDLIMPYVQSDMAICDVYELTQAGAS